MRRTSSRRILREGCNPHAGLADMGDETWYDIEISQTPRNYVAKMRSPIRPQKPIREYNGRAIEDILDQIVRDILDDQED